MGGGDGAAAVPPDPVGVLFGEVVAGGCAAVAATGAVFVTRAATNVIERVVDADDDAGRDVVAVRGAMVFETSAATGADVFVGAAVFADDTTLRTVVTVCVAGGGAATARARPESALPTD